MDSGYHIFACIIFFQMHLYGKSSPETHNKKPCCPNETLLSQIFFHTPVKNKCLFIQLYQ